MPPSLLGRAVLIGLAAAVMLLVGCNCTPFIPERAESPPPVVMPTYGEIAARYNAHLAELPRLWARASVDLKIHDADGDEHRESLDGKLIVQPPRRVALALDKLGFEQLLVGSNPEYYWVIDLTSEPRRVYFGMQANVGRPGTRPLPSPVQPRDLVHLLGIVDLPVGDDVDYVSPLGWQYGAVVIDRPDAPMRLYLDAETGLPVRVEVLDSDGAIVAVSRLADHLPVDDGMGGIADVPAMVASRVEISAPATGDRVRMTLSKPTSDSARVDPRVFDPEFLVEQVYEIERENRINLDQ